MADFGGSARRVLLPKALASVRPLPPYLPCVDLAVNDLLSPLMEVNRAKILSRPRNGPCSAPSPPPPEPMSRAHQVAS